jgi:[acyl-carrier-protein] S-malonyltransferase
MTVNAEPGAIALAFPGMGAKPCGHELEFYRRHESLFDPFLEEGAEATGLDLVETLCTGSLGWLTDRQSQFFTYSFSAGCHAVLREHQIVPRLMAGYSFGIYSALQSCGAITFSDGLSLIRESFRLMEETCRGRDVGMAVVIGLSESDVDAIIADAGFTSVCVVNVNNETCRIFAGLRDELHRFVALALKADAIKGELLPVDIPYHHPKLLGPASKAFSAFLRRIAWQWPSCPVVSSIDQSLLGTREQLIDFAARNLSCPINWNRTIGAMAEADVHRVVECGPGITLTQNGRFMPVAIDFVNLKNIARKLGL